MTLEGDRPFCRHRQCINRIWNTRINNTVLDGPIDKVNCCTQGHRTNTARQMRKKGYKHNTGIYSRGHGRTTDTSEVPRRCGQSARWLAGGRSGWRPNVRPGLAMVNLLWPLLLLANFAFVPITCQDIIVTINPDRVEVTEGLDTTLHCNYTIPDIAFSQYQDLASQQSDPDPIVKWYKDGDLLQTYSASDRGTVSQSDRISILPPASLRISPAIDEDTGSYICQIERGELTGTASATLHVLGDTPVLLGNEGRSETSVLEGDTLLLRCSGNYPLSWTYHQSVDHRKVSISSTLTPIPDSDSWDETNELVVKNATATDTGFFTCMHTHENEAFSTSIYVYVNASDADSLFLPIDSPTISVYALDSVILPCRVTVPSVEVDLVMPNGRLVPRESLPDYDNKIGFTVPGSEASLYQGNVTCRTTYEGMTAQQTFLVQIIKKPVILNSTPNVTINEFTKLTLVCEGALPLMWVHELPDMEFDIVVSTLRQENGDVYYRSTLSIDPSRYSDTGYFSCLFLRYLKKEDPELRASIYVFVSSEDSERIFLSRYAKDIPYNKSSPFTVPCRVSNPSLPVSFRVLYKEKNEIYENFDWTYTYDPKVGFMLEPERSALEAISLRFTCYAEVDGGDQARITMLLDAGKDEKPLLKLRLSQDKREVIADKEGFRLTCTAHGPQYLLFLENSFEYEPSFAWVPPGGRRPTNLLQLGRNYDHREFKFKPIAEVLYFKYLEVENATVEQSGTYTCYAENIGLAVEERISIQVHERGYAGISHRYNASDPSTNLTAIVGHAKCIFFDVPAYPPPNVVVSPQRNWSLSLDVSTKVLSMCSSNITEAYEGVYNVYVWNEYQNASLNFSFAVQVPPQVIVSIEPEPTRLFNSTINGFVRDQTYTIECRSTGKPKPTALWLYQRCTTYTSQEPECSVDDSWVPVDGSSDFGTVEYNNENSIATLTVTSKDWTLYRCLVLSSSSFFADIEETVNFRVLDSANGVAIAGDSDTAYVSDNLILECYATIFFFTEIQWVYINPNGTALWLDGTTQTSYLYSLSSTLHVTNITFENAGSYICAASNGNNPAWEKNATQIINVREVSEPRILGASEEPILISLDRMKDNLNIHCLAQGYPPPTLSLHRLSASSTPLEDAVVGSNASVSWLNYEVIRPTIELRGTYECIAESRGGEDRQRYEVSITEHPELRIMIVNNEVKPGENVTIKCFVVRGFPIPKVQLRKESVASYLSQGIGNISHTIVTTVDDAGKYYCEALDANSTLEYAELIIEQAPTKTLEKILPYLILLVCLLLLIILVFFIWKCRRRPKVRRASRLPPMELPRLSTRRSLYSVSDDHYMNLPYDERWEFPRERLKLGGVIGKGAFGMVIKAVAVGIDGTEKNITVAVKRLKSGATSQEKKALWAELKMLGHIGKHLNVVNFLGACTQNGPVLAIVEFCCHGNLLDFLRSKRKYFSETPEASGSLSHTGHSSYSGASSTGNFQTSSGSERRMKAVYDQVMIPEEVVAPLQDDPIDVQDLLCYSFQVARGMEFLASKNVIHRDLAARNVLVTDNYTLKICDFGLAKHLYDDPDYVASGKQGRLPIKWMAPESIFDKVFTMYSDVWAYAVFLWEVFSLGGSPYPGIQIDEKFYNKIKNGYRMNAPDYAPNGVYDIMLECWTPDPESRPSFSILSVRLGDMLEASVRSEYIELNFPFEQSNEVSPQLPSPHEDTPLLRPHPPTHFKPSPANSVPNTPPITTRMIRSDSGEHSNSESTGLSPPINGLSSRPFPLKDTAHNNTNVQEINEIEAERDSKEDEVFLEDEVTTSRLTGTSIDATVHV